ncbi:MAG TPA: type II secretion system secretin GspD [Planctomycetota bacterium]|nr:type II secretion system secretin GspD [Planctomycetota bacterium]
MKMTPRKARRAVAFVAQCLAFIAATYALDARAEEKPLPQAILMNFKDMPLETVMEQLSEMSGLVIIKDFTLEGRITIISKQAMNVEDAIALLNSVLKEKGYVGIRTGRVLKLVKLDEAKKRNIPVRTGSDPKLIPDTDEVVTQVIPVKFIDAVQLKKDFAPLIPAYADLTANASSNSLLITDTSSNIRRIAEIIHAMDTQSTVVSEVKVFQLKYANASSAARLINETFKDDDQQQSQQNLPPWQRRGGPAAFFGGGGRGGGAQGNENQTSDEQGQRVRKVSASADERTNAVVVSANPDVMPLIAQVLKDLDSNPAEEQSVFMYRCKNAQAVNLETVINALFGVSGSGINRSATTTRRNGGAGTDVQRGASSNRLPGSNVSSGGFGGGNTGFGGNTGAGGAGGFGNQAANRGQGNRVGGALGNSMSGDLTGQVYTVADIDSNSLIVLTASKNFERVKAIIADLDKPVPQVFIKVLIAEVTHDKSTDAGVDASVLTNGTVQSVMTDFNAASQTVGLITKLAHKDLAVTLHALEQVGKLEILSRPYILASDNQLSSITVGQEVPFIVSSRTTETGQTINTIQYQDIGIILSVTAHINEEGLVILDVAPEVSSLTGTTVPISENVSAPVFAKRSALSRVGIKDGQTIVIGGLMEDRKTETEQGVPILRKIPGLGTLFRRKQTTKAKTELLIFLTPHVAQDPSKLKEMSLEEEERLRLVPKAVRPGAYLEQKEGMGRKGEIILPPEGKKDERRRDPASDELPLP